MVPYYRLASNQSIQAILRALISGSWRFQRKQLACRLISFARSAAVGSLAFAPIDVCFFVSFSLDLMAAVSLSLSPRRHTPTTNTKQALFLVFYYGNTISWQPARRFEIQMTRRVSFARLFPQLPLLLHFYFRRFVGSLETSSSLGWPPRSLLAMQPSPQSAVEGCYFAVGTRANKQKPIQRDKK